MKKFLKIVSIVCISIFGILFIGEYFLDYKQVTLPLGISWTKLEGIAVLTYILTNGIYSKIDLDEKDNKIVKLKKKVKELEGDSRTEQ